ncbi:putative gustatory receptor 2a [Schistocerca cancellata]|uniref:putative gustatory receptor 2a n=1 Tax=Schistocerca cancellata TaxID=274614 RepID=UPI002117E7E3|nr:putative gustatory receptor 2a [Schistocerca cancellata]
MPKVIIYFSLGTYSLLWHVQFFGIVLLVRDRLGAINTLLLAAVRPPLGSEAELEELVTQPSLAGRALVVEDDLLRLQRATLALHRTARLCRRHFGPALLLAVLRSFASVVSLSYAVLETGRRSQMPERVRLPLVAGLSCWLGLSLCHALLACWVCSSAAERAATVGLRMARVRLLVRSSGSSGVLQLPVDRLHFSAAGFFDIDLPLFVSITTAAVAYLVVLIQFSAM